jgi:hypothetical protein
MTRAAAGAILLLGLAFGGCAEPTLVLQRGGIGGGLYLLTMTVTDPQRVPSMCGTAAAAGCEISLPIEREGHTVTVSFITIRHDGAAESTYAIMAHEACHALARAQGLTSDPCHREDGGMVRTP